MISPSVLAAQGYAMQQQAYGQMNPYASMGTGGQSDWGFGNAVMGSAFGTKPPLPEGMTRLRYDQDRAFAASTYLHHLAAGGLSLGIGTGAMMVGWSSAMSRGGGMIGEYLGGYAGALGGHMTRGAFNVAERIGHSATANTLGLVFGENAVMNPGAMGRTTSGIANWMGRAGKTVGGWGSEGGFLSDIGEAMTAGGRTLGQGGKIVKSATWAGQGLGSLTGSMVLPMVVSEVGIEAGMTFYDRAKTFSEFEKDIRDKGERILYGSKSTYEEGRAGFSSAQSARLMNRMSGVADSYSRGYGAIAGGRYNPLGGAQMYNEKMQDLKSMFSLGADMGMFDGSTGYDEVEQKLLSINKQVTRLTTALAKTKAKIMEDIKAVQSSGGELDIDAAGGVLMGRHNLAVRTGLSSDAVSAYSNLWGRQATNMGVGGHGMMKLAENNLLLAASAQPSGLLSKRDVMSLGGVEGIANSLSGAQMSFMQNPVFSKYATMFGSRGPDGSYSFNSAAFNAAGTDPVSVQARQNAFGGLAYNTNNRYTAARMDANKFEFVNNASAFEVQRMMKMVMNDAISTSYLPAKEAAAAALIENFGMSGGAAFKLAPLLMDPTGKLEEELMRTEQNQLRVNVMERRHGRSPGFVVRATTGFGLFGPNPVSRYFAGGRTKREQDELDRGVDEFYGKHEAGIGLALMDTSSAAAMFERSIITESPKNASALQIGYSNSINLSKGDIAYSNELMEMSRRGDRSSPLDGLSDEMVARTLGATAVPVLNKMRNLYRNKTEWGAWALAGFRTDISGNKSREIDNPLDVNQTVIAGKIYKMMEQAGIPNRADVLERIIPGTGADLYSTAPGFRNDKAATTDALSTLGKFFNEGSTKIYDLAAGMTTKQRVAFSKLSEDRLKKVLTENGYLEEKVAFQKEFGGIGEFLTSNSNYKIKSIDLGPYGPEYGVKDTLKNLKTVVANTYLAPEAQHNLYKSLDDSLDLTTMGIKSPNDLFNTRAFLNSGSVNEELVTSLGGPIAGDLLNKFRAIQGNTPGKAAAIAALKNNKYMSGATDFKTTNSILDPLQALIMSVMSQRINAKDEGIEKYSISPEEKEVFKGLTTVIAALNKSLDTTAAKDKLMVERLQTSKGYGIK